MLMLFCSGVKLQSNNRAIKFLVLNDISHALCKFLAWRFFPGLTYISSSLSPVLDVRWREQIARRYRRRAIILASDHFLNCKSWQQCGSKFKKMIASWFWIFSTSSSLASSFSNHRCTDYKKKIKDLCSDYNRSQSCFAMVEAANFCWGGRWPLQMVACSRLLSSMKRAGDLHGRKVRRKVFHNVRFSFLSIFWISCKCKLQLLTFVTKEYIFFDIFYSNAYDN